MKHGKSAKKSWKKGTILTAAMLTVALGLLGASVVGSSRAALTYFSDVYGARVSMDHIGVTLEQNDLNSDLDESSRVSWRYYNDDDNSDEQENWDEHTGELVKNILQQTDGELKIGHRYDEWLRVRNSGTIPEYVRVTIYRYWETKDASGVYEKAPELDSDLIKLNLINSDVWQEDKSARTEERRVLYYTGTGVSKSSDESGVLLVGVETEPFSDWLEIQDEPVEAAVTKYESTDENGNTVITTEYDYDDARFVLKVDVEAVQNNNARTTNGAMISAWGTTGTWPVIDE